jgi:2-oxoglutarate dehydrogenase E2 component (dihydrolipoamide succinyltransferase)
MTDIKVISSSESVMEADIARWFKQDGDVVEMDEPLLELETDKASLEINAPVAGRLRITVEEGTTVEVGQVIGHIEEGATAAPKAPAPKGDDDEAAAEAAAEADSESEASVPTDVKATSLNPEMPSPAARKLLAEHNISSQDVPGTGKNGRITKADVLNFLKDVQKQNSVLKRTEQKPSFAVPEEGAAPVISPDETVTFMRNNQGRLVALTSEDGNSKSAPPPKKERPAETATRSAPDLPPMQQTGGGNERTIRRERMSRLRRTLSKRLVDAQQNAALLTTFNEVDMSAIMDIRKKYKEEFTKTHNVGLGFMSFFTKAAAQALREFPIINAQVDGDEIIYQDYIDVGIAVASPKGLVVPVVRDADRLSFWGIETAIAHLAKRARSGTLTPDDLTGGTFTITNGGVFGSMLSTPIVNAPQSAILGMHNIVQRPVVKNGEVVVAPIMYLAVSYDHRIIDGSDSVRFLVKIKQLLEDPTRLLLEI